MVAVGEDHAVPRPDWCEAVMRAHAEHPDGAAVVGCLVNATDATLAGRANFLAFATLAAADGDPAPGPPAVLGALLQARCPRGHHVRATGLRGRADPSLFERGLMVADERVVADHFQDHGCRWSIYNGFDSARSSYGYKRSVLTPGSAELAAGRHGIPRQLRSSCARLRRAGPSAPRRR